MLGLSKSRKIWQGSTWRRSRLCYGSIYTVQFDYAENVGAFLSVGFGLSYDVRTLLFQAGVGTRLVGLVIFILVTPSVATRWLG